MIHWRTRWQHHALPVGVLLLVVICPTVAEALNPACSVFEYNCQTWRRADGLPVNSVNAIAQTADGRLWLGTSQGLIYFNGVDFRIVKPAKNRVEDMVVTALARRRTQGLWYGLASGGFGVFDGENFHERHFQGLSEPMSTVHKIVAGNNGAMLLAADNAAGRFHGTNSYDSMLPAPGADVFSIGEDAKGRVWIGTVERGLFYWQKGKLFRFPDPTLRGLIVSSIAVEPSGKLWIGVAHPTGGLRCYDSHFHRLPLPNDIPEAKALLLDSHGVLWIGTSGSGLARYKDGKFTFFRKEDGLANNRVLTLAESEDGSLWIGTVDGLTELSDVKFPTLSQTEGMVSEACLSVAPAPHGGVWATTPDGVSFYHNGKFSNFGADGADGFTSQWIKRAFVARNGDVYFIDAHKNLDRFSGNRVVKTWTNGLWPRAVAEDATGLVAAFQGTLMRLEDGKLVPFLLSNGGKVSLNWINDLLVAHDGSIWVASDKGVCQIKNGMLRDWSQTNGMPNVKAFFLCQDDLGAIWAAQQHGIARFKNGVERMLTRKQGLYDDSVSAIVPDRLGYFWMNSYHGIYRVRQSELDAVADGTAPRVNCQVYEGLDSVKTTDQMEQDYSGCRSADGRIWFPSAKGLIMIDPAHVAHSARPPTVFLEQVRVNGRKYDTDSEPSLEPGPGNLEFDYVALDYAAPQGIRYRYRLEGYDADWVNAGTRRSAFYTNIKPGHYRFQVQACSSDGVWNTTGASMELNLPDRFYDTLAFRGALAAAVLGLAAYFWWSWHVRRRQVQLQKANALMEARVQERTSQLARTNAALLSEIEQRKLAQEKSEALQDQLVNASRQAGQAEVASSVLHNVGNVLNSVNISTTVLAQRLRASRIKGLAKAADLLRQNGANLDRFLKQDARGQKLPDYLDQLADYLGQERDDMLTELKGLSENAEHIKEIIAMQQNYAKISGVQEKVVMSELVDSALRLQTGTYARHGVDVVRKYDAVPEVLVEKHKVLQILINLIQNAKQACDAGSAAQKRVIVRIGHQEPDHIAIAIEDNGIGIAPENLTRIFSHGFTTRKDGHGFGLHSAALAAHEMGGRLTASSEGHNKGATFTLELPIRHETDSQFGAPAAIKTALNQPTFPGALSQRETAGIVGTSPGNGTL